jgi:hypothetical protein
MKDIFVLCVNATDEASSSSGFDLRNGFSLEPRFEDFETLCNLFL